MNLYEDILPGVRVMVFDPRLFKDDVTTPLSHTVRPATVVSRYGKIERYYEERVQYPDLVDVRFDHRPNDISGGHFTSGVHLLHGPGKDPKEV